MLADLIFRLDADHRKITLSDIEQLCAVIMESVFVSSFLLGAGSALLSAIIVLAYVAWRDRRG